MSSASCLPTWHQASPKEWDALHECCKGPRQDVGYSERTRFLASLTTMGQSYMSCQYIANEWLLTATDSTHLNWALEAGKPTCVSISRVRKSSMSRCSPSVTKYGVPGVPLEMASLAASAKFLHHTAP